MADYIALRVVRLHRPYLSPPTAVEPRDIVRASFRWLGAICRVGARAARLNRATAFFDTPARSRRHIVSLAPASVKVLRAVKQYRLVEYANPDPAIQSLRAWVHASALDRPTCGR